MAGAPQGLCTFDGIKAVMSASFTLTHGTQPNVCQIQIPPQPQGLKETGTLKFTYGKTEVAFEGCKVDSVQASRDGQGRVVWTINVLDPRWKWRIGGHVSGYYNVRRGSGIVRETLKTPQELATLCLEAMDVERFDVKNLTNDVYPEIEWDFTLAADALDDICNSLGFRVVPKRNKLIALEKVGEGKPLPEGGAMTNEAAIDPPERPDELIFVTGRCRYQVDLPLEMVMEDLDGVIKPFKECSYGPERADNGELRKAGIDWNFYELMANSIAPERARELAKRWAFRAYRVKLDKAKPLRFYLPSGKSIPVTSLKQILPLEDHQLEIGKDDLDAEEAAAVAAKAAAAGPAFRDEPGELRRKAAVVWGTFWVSSDGGYNSYEELKKPSSDDLVKYPDFVYPKDWHLDRERGIVIFGEPVVARELTGNKIKVDAEGHTMPEFIFSPAILFLRTTISLRDPDTRAWFRYTVSRKSKQKKFGTKPQVILHDDVEAWAYHDPSRKGKFTSNIKEIDDAAQHYLDEKEKEFKPRDSQTVSYAGLLAIDLDGATQQVTWSIDDSGYATTTASRNREDPRLSQTNGERQLFQGINAVLAREALLGGDRAAKDRLAKGA